MWSLWWLSPRISRTSHINDFFLENLIFNNFITVYLWVKAIENRIYWTLKVSTFWYYTSLLKRRYTKVGLTDRYFLACYKTNPIRNITCLKGYCIICLLQYIDRLLALPHISNIITICVIFKTFYTTLILNRSNGNIKDMTWLKLILCRYYQDLPR